jgi:hypothetical protein
MTTTMLEIGLVMLKGIAAIQIVVLITMFIARVRVFRRKTEMKTAIFVAALV